MNTNQILDILHRMAVEHSEFREFSDTSVYEEGYAQALIDVMEHFSGMLEVEEPQTCGEEEDL